MSINFYKLLHLVSVMVVFASLGGLCFVASEKRRLLVALHGVGMLALLVAGFGLLAKLGFVQGGLPLWAAVKLGIWVALGVVPVLMRKLPSFARLILLLSIALGGYSAHLAITKNFSL